MTEIEREKARRMRYNELLSHPALEYGKIPPQAVDLEEAVIGAAMLESYCIPKIRSILSTQMFYKDAHQKIYEAICQLYDERKPVDILTVTNQLRSNGNLDIVGGAYYIGRLIDRVSSGANSEFHASIIYEKYIAREIISLSSEAIKKAFEDTEDPFEIKNELIVGIGNLENKENKTKTTSDVRGEFDSYISDVINGRIKPIKTGLNGYDEHNGGLHKGDLTIIGAWSSNGKTLTALNIMLEASITNKCKFYSWEQSDMQLYLRNISMLSKNNGRDIIKGIIKDHTSLVAAQEEIGRRNIKYGNCSNHIRNIVEDITKDATEMGTEIFLLDYLQLLESDEKDLRKSIGYIANRLKRLAKELNVCIILMSQLTRSDGKKKPGMSGLKEAGEIENAADQVLTCWIPFNEPSELEELSFKGTEFKTVEWVNGEKYKLMLFYKNKDRNAGICSFYGWLDEYMRIHNELPIQYSNSFPMNEKQTTIKPNKEFDERPF